jgi:hypothetical protein
MSESWSGTVSGNLVDFLDPDPDSITALDIATGLAHVSRFSGQIERHYSVAAHSMCVARTVFHRTKDPIIALQGLLHDASEAYMGDCPSPLKRLLGPVWGDIEERLMHTIYDKWEIPRQMHYEVKDADKRWCITEKHYLQPNGPSWDGTAMHGVVPYPLSKPLHPSKADRLIDAYMRLFAFYVATTPTREFLAGR